MATVILVRHGRTSANASGVLAGRLPGVELDEVGLEQAEHAAARIGAIPIADLVSSPMDRCRQTAASIQRALKASQGTGLRVRSEKGLSECDYGEWQGRSLAELAKEPLWRVVQRQPSAATFPGGEAMITMQSRAVAAVRRHDAAIEAEHGPGAVWVAVSHGDLIKSVLADALGMHLDLFQRIHVDPASISVIRYGESRPTVLASNTHAGDLAWLTRQAPSSGDAPVGGGAGPTPDSKASS